MKMVLEALGLSSIIIAADTYTSVLSDLAHKAAEDVAALLTPPKRRTSSSRRGLGVVTDAAAEQTS